MFIWLSEVHNKVLCDHGRNYMNPSNLIPLTVCSWEPDGTDFSTGKQSLSLPFVATPDGDAPGRRQEGGDGFIHAMPVEPSLYAEWLAAAHSTNHGALLIPPPSPSTPVALFPIVRGGRGLLIVCRPRGKGSGEDDRAGRWRCGRFSGRLPSRT